MLHTLSALKFDTPGNAAISLRLLAEEVRAERITIQSISGMVTTDGEERNVRFIRKDQRP